MGIIAAKSVAVPGISSADEIKNRNNALIRKAVFEGGRKPSPFFESLNLFAVDWLVATKDYWMKSTFSSVSTTKNVTLPSSNNLNLDKSSLLQTKKFDYNWLFEHFSRPINESSYFLHDYVAYYWQRNFPSANSLYVKYYKAGGFELMESYVSKNEAYGILINYIETGSNFNDTEKGYLELLDYTLNKPSVLSALGLNEDEKKDIIDQSQNLSASQMQSGQTNKYDEDLNKNTTQSNSTNQDRTVFVIALLLLFGVFLLRRFKKKV